MASATERQKQKVIDSLKEGFEELFSAQSQKAVTGVERESPEVSISEVSQRMAGVLVENLYGVQDWRLLKNKPTTLQGFGISQSDSYLSSPSSYFSLDEEGNVYTEKNLYSKKGVSAFGFGGSGDTPGSVDVLSNWEDYSEEKELWALSAKLGKSLLDGKKDNFADGYYSKPGHKHSIGDITGLEDLSTLLDLFDWFEWDEDNQAIRVKYALYSIADLSAFGVGTGSGTGSGGGYERLDDWLSYDVSKEGWVLSAGLGYGLKVMVDGKSPIGHKHTISDISNFTPYSHPDYSQENEIGGTLGHIKASKMAQIDILLSLFERKGAGTELNPYVIEAKYDFYSIGGSSAYGLGVLGGGSGGGYERLDDWASYDASKATWVLSAKLGVDLNTSLAGKQAQLNGTGLVRMSGTGVTYDNTSYATTSSLSNYLSLSGGNLNGFLQVNSYLRVNTASYGANKGYIYFGDGTLDRWIGYDGNNFALQNGSGGQIIYHTGNLTNTLSNGYLPYWNGSSLSDTYLSINSSGVFFNGINASAHRYFRLNKTSGYDGGILWQLSGNEKFQQVITNSGDMDFYNYTYGGVTVRFLANGNVGIGYTDRSEKFAVAGNGYFNGSLTNVGHHYINGVGNYLWFDTLGAASSNYIGTVNNYDLRLVNTRGTGSWLDLRSDGSIYTSGVFETYGHARIGFNGSSGLYIASSSRYLWPGAGGSLSLGTSGVDRIYITGAGFSKMSNTGYFSNVSGSYHEILSDSSLTALISSEISSGSANILYLSFRNLSPDDNSRFLNCYSTSGSKFLLYASGRVWAANYIESASYLKGTSIKIGANWEAIPSGTSDAYLDLKYNGVLKARLDSSGNITAVGGVTAFAV